MRAATTPAFLLALLSTALLGTSCGNQEAPTPPEPASSATQSASAPTPANPGQPAPEPTNVAAAVLTVEETTHDFGIVDDTRLLRCEFPFENTGKGTLKIREMKSSCGCTTPELEKMSFEPGEGDVVRVEWKPKGHGLQAQTVDLFLEGKPSPQRLTIRARVKPKIQVAPLTADFGKIPQHTQKTMALTLKTDDPQLEILSVKPKVPSAVLANFVPSGNEGMLGTVNVQLLPRDRGAFGSSFTIRSRLKDPQTGEPYEYEMDVPVRASIYGAVQLDPNAFYVGKVSPRGTVDYTVRLRRPDGSPFEIQRAEVIQCTVDGLKVLQKPGADGEGSYLDLSLQGPVGEYLGPLRGKVALLTDVPGDSLQELPIMGVIRK